MSQVIKITGSTATSADSISQIDIPEDGEIVAIVGSSLSSDATIGESSRCELSFLTTNQITANDARGTILQVASNNGGGTGALGYAGNASIGLGREGIPVSAGERLHIHTLQSAAHQQEVTFLIYLEFKGGSRRATRRR